MFKLFPGFHLVEEYQKKKKERRLSDDKTVSKAIKLIIAIGISLILWLLPSEAFGIEGLTLIEQRVIAIFVMATLMWILEPIPAWTTSTIAVVLLLFTCSNSSLWLFSEGVPAEELGTPVKYVSILHCYADPIIMLFIGGFILAIAATKTGLDGMLARVMLKPFGTQSRFVLLGFLVVTAVFSMFLSNTATAAMMLTFLTPVLKALPADGKGRIALALAIPVAANVGGMGTPIGTPPNAIALKYLNDPAGMNLNIGFGEWMLFMIPFTLVVMFIAWVVLLKLFPFKQKTIHLDIKGEAKKDWRSIVVYITFAITVLLWVTDKFTGVNSNVVAMLPVGVFCAIGVITKRDLEEISWSVLWMVAGGFALGVALNETGLATHMIQAIPFDTWPPMLMIIGSGLICYAMANFISHTATAALLIPILAVAGMSMSENLAPLGGVLTLLIGVAIGSSLGMVLPISTPPNALAHAPGMIEQKDMARIGLIMGVVGLILGYSMLIVLGSSGYFG
ncbi:MAG: SLC13/DASS family transporter [Bacteroidaceae bacterium]|nr:SLC13/DASS family transporter [Bacteroidaceae bacterium]